MKRGTPHHPKTLALAAALGVDRCVAVGLLEGLFHWAGTYARRGDVGKHADSSIASGIGTTLDAELVISALIASGWLDRCECHRLRVHDWPEHADQAVERSSEVKKAGFLACYASVQRPASVPLESDSKNAPASGTGHRADGTGQTADGNGNGGLAHRETMLDKQRQDYAHEVWAAFLAKTGQPETRPMGPLDWTPLKNWLDAGVPLRAVLTAIRETKGKGGTLGYYGPSVKAEWDRVRRGRVTA